MLKAISRVFILLCCTGSLWAEPVRVTLSPVIVTVFPQAIGIVEQALKDAGFTPELIILPTARALQMVIQGEADMTLARIDLAVSDSDTMIKVEPAVGSFTAKMIVTKERKNLCDINESDFKNLSITGVRGVITYEKVLYPQFGRVEVSPAIENSLKMLITQRADVTYWIPELLTGLDSQIASRFHVCENHVIKLSVYSYLNQDFAWAKDRIEAAYREIFN